ncbi:MAG: HAD family hydrolase [Clostridiales bacterium]|nr:HAD family hydrolase [Clostridiales bacterium]
MRYDLLIFDLDGTVLDTIEDLAIAMNHAREVCGLEPQPIEMVKAMVGNGIRKLIERSTKDDGEVDKDRIYLEFMSFYNEHCIDSTKPYEGITDLLKTLKGRKVKIYILTNKPAAPSEILIRHCFPGLVDEVRGNTEGIPLKPDPTVINGLIERSGIEKNKCALVGDSEVDIHTAKNANIDSISVSWGFKTRAFLEENGADIIFDSAEKLKKYLENQ